MTEIPLVRIALCFISLMVIWVPYRILIHKALTPGEYNWFLALCDIISLTILLWVSKEIGE